MKVDDMMNHTIFPEKRGIVIACDVTTLDLLEKLVTETSAIEGVVGYKIGSILGLKYGLNAITRIISRQSRLPIIYDHQKAGTDIPALAKKLIVTCKDADISAMIIFPFAGPATLESFVDTARDLDVSLIAGAAMTHQRFFESEGGYLSSQSIERMYDKAASLGIAHFVVPATRPTVLSQYLHLILRHCESPSFLLPGIGAQGGSISDTFKQLDNYNAYAIVGSAIYEAESIQKSARRFATEAIANPLG